MNIVRELRRVLYKRLKYGNRKICTYKCRMEIAGWDTIFNRDNI